MIWYRAIMTNYELQKGLGEQLENDFEFLYHRMDQPDRMAIYKSDYLGDFHLYYYISIPDNFAFNLGEIFRKYKVSPTLEPTGQELKLLLGYTDQMAAA